VVWVGYNSETKMDLEEKNVTEARVNGWKKWTAKTYNPHCFCCGLGSRGTSNGIEVVWGRV